MNNLISAKIIADSIDKNNVRITTMAFVLPRMILAELNTHRALSKNSASSRAIPTHVMLEAVEKNAFIPLKFQKNHKGMQGTHYFEEPKDIEYLTLEWLSARNSAVKHAKKLNEYKLTKQMANRILEPFMYHTVLLTATDWENFFALRAEEAADIHIQDLAYKALTVYNESEPKSLNKGDWHIPFGDLINDKELYSLYVGPDSVLEQQNWLNLYKLKIATARCAQTSYTIINEEGKALDYEKLIGLHDRLAKMGHWSPFEHCAECTEDENYYGNFKSWRQYRKFFPNENRSDSRVIKKYWKAN